jgi:glyoxylase-like metal-dependent hydrolase (beta-lactamase superfamily II)
MVSTVSSVVICPPEGNLEQYLHSLRHLLNFPARLLLPGHGSASARPMHLLEQSLEHRRLREGELLAALKDGPHKVPQLAQTVYRGLAPPLIRFAELQILAGLQKLEREGRASRSDAGWERVGVA